MPYYNYNNHACWYEEHGEGDPLLMLHGNTASSRIFDGVYELFTKKYRVILIDFLGHGRSDRIKSFPDDLWYDEGMQVVEFIKQKNIGKTYMIGSSGGALAAVNAALEAPELFIKVIADSFEGETPMPSFVETVECDREASKANPGAREFYISMHGEGWENVVDNDTHAVTAHAKTIGKFFHKPFSMLKTDILMTGSREDEYTAPIAADFYDKIYAGLIQKAGHGKMHVFEHGGHPAIITNPDEFFRVACEFFGERCF
ncbi:2-succinyl-6-hydroxy-2,4-cyclohexadiene-1-carboxylate synthase [bioreactor metagenome]|uniref:2-succinyl-6-hydroxy-2, 4-cyclohexadiene-1-carboxylate synthase n=1 Tax=bioreactor metagenome TaxID=1076179 RepID=A0A645BLA6_9ZZZZ|nr:alpha/beta fold hydrolase [Oscillospiraceae bacterium]